MESLVHDSEEAFGIGDVEFSVGFKRIFEKLCLCHVISVASIFSLQIWRCNA